MKAITRDRLGPAAHIVEPLANARQADSRGSESKVVADMAPGIGAKQATASDARGNESGSPTSAERTAA